MGRLRACICVNTAHACSHKRLQREAGLNIVLAMIPWHSPPDKLKSVLHRPPRNLQLIAYVCHINEQAMLSCVFSLEVNDPVSSSGRMVKIKHRLHDREATLAFLTVTTPV